MKVKKIDRRKESDEKPLTSRIPAQYVSK